MSAAAFGRLCVETANEIEWQFEQGAAAFGRLCVETTSVPPVTSGNKQPPSGGCVLKQYWTELPENLI